MTSRRSSGTASKLRKKAASSNDESKKHQGLVLPNVHTTWCPSLLEYDKCHNSAAPCCNALRDIVIDIFPEIVALGDVKCENINGTKKKASSVGMCSLISTGIGISEEDTKDSHSGEFLDNEVNLCQNRPEQSSLFSQVVRKYILQDRLNRINQRGSIPVLYEQSSVARSTFDSTPSANANSDTSSSKKKRKKKKKKSKLSSEGTASSNTSSSVTNATTTAQASGAHPSSRAPTPEKSQETNNADELVPPKNDKIDEILDKIILQSNNANSISTPNKRDLLSLFSYIENTANSTNAILPKSTHHKTKSSKISQSMDTTMRPIPVTEINDIVGMVRCRHCQSDCIEYIKNLSYNSSPTRMTGYSGNRGFSSPLEVDSGGPNIELLEQYSPPSNSVEVEMLGSGNEKMTILQSIHLDGSSMETETCVPGLLPARNQFGMGGIEDEENAFGYSLMEENNDDISNKQNGPCNRGGPRIDLVQQEGTLAKYFQMGFENDRSTFSVQDFDCLVKEVIIPCVMIEASSVVTKEDYKKVSERADIIFKETNQLVENVLPEILEAAENAMKDAVASLKRFGPFNVNAVKALKECGEKQVEYMDNCRKLLTKLDWQSVSLRAGKHEHERWSNALMENLWEVYMECSKSMAEPSLQYLWKGIELACAGSVPLQFNSPEQRENLKTMLEKRNSILGRLNEKIMLELFSFPSGGDDSSCFLRRFITFGEYFALKEECGDDTTDLASAVDLMLELRDELTSKIIYQTEVSTILEMQSSTCTKLYNQCINAFELANEYLKNTDLNRKDKITWQENSINIEEDQMFIEEFLGQECEPSLERHMNEVQYLSTFVKKCLKQCRFYRQVEAAKVVLDTNQSIMTPPQIFKLCEVLGSGLIPTLKCEGGFAKRRIAGIVSVCLYSWLQERCMEWHADLTHQELMIETEEELLKERKEIASTEQKKKSKKKKKNKKWKTPAAEEVQEKALDDSEAVPKSDKGDSEEESSTAAENSLDNENISSDPEEVALVNYEQIDSNASLEEGKPTAILSKENGKDEEENGIDVGVLHKNPLLEKEVSQVCVVDKGKLITAESFLCARYFHALDDDNVYHLK